MRGRVGRSLKNRSQVRVSRSTYYALYDVRPVKNQFFRLIERWKGFVDVLQMVIVQNSGIAMRWRLQVPIQLRHTKLHFPDIARPLNDHWVYAIH